MAREFHDLAPAAAALDSGGILLLNTDTLPGFHCRADRSRSVQRLIALKERPDGQPLLVLAGSLEQALTLTVDLDSRQRDVCRRCWPGPFSLILPARPDLVPEITAGMGTIAVRVPGRPTLRDLVLAVGVPLVSTSVNTAGETPCPDLVSAVGRFGPGVDGFWHDGGPPGGGGPSALVDVSVWPPVLLREGPLALPDLGG